MSRKEIESKKEFARVLYMDGNSQVEICDKVNVSRTTLSKWISMLGWAEMRAAISITRPELINKALITINNILDQINASDADVADTAAAADKLSKLASFIEKLDRKENVVDAVNVFMAFNSWLQYRMKADPELTPELVKVVNKYQDMYLAEKFRQKIDR
jgi:hypothetical protein